MRPIFSLPYPVGIVKQTHISSDLSQPGLTHRNSQPSRTCVCMRTCGLRGLVTPELMAHTRHFAFRSATWLKLAALPLFPSHVPVWAAKPSLRYARGQPGTNMSLTTKPIRRVSDIVFSMSIQYEGESGSCQSSSRV